MTSATLSSVLTLYVVLCGNPFQEKNLRARRVHLDVAYCSWLRSKASILLSTCLVVLCFLSFHRMVNNEMVLVRGFTAPDSNGACCLSYLRALLIHINAVCEVRCAIGWMRESVKWTLLSRAVSRRTFVSSLSRLLRDMTWLCIHDNVSKYELILFIRFGYFSVYYIYMWVSTSHALLFSFIRIQYTSPSLGFRFLTDSALIERYFISETCNEFY